MKRSDRLKELEENATGIDPKYRELMDLYFKFEEALENDNRKLAKELREKADPFFEEEKKLQHFPANDSDVSGIVSLTDWQVFVKYNFN